MITASCHCGLVRHATTVSFGERRRVAVVEAGSVGPTSCLAPVIAQQGALALRWNRNRHPRR